MKKISLLVVLLVFSVLVNHAQTYSKVDSIQVCVQAKNLVKEHINMLNIIGNDQLSQVERKAIIFQSYADPNNRIYNDDKIIIEDNLDATADYSSALSKDWSIVNYLKNYDLFYLKSENESVFISNIQVSILDKGQYDYVKVAYDLDLRNKARNQSQSFPIRKRIAEVKFHKVKNKVKTHIVSITNIRDSLFVICPYDLVNIENNFIVPGGLVDKGPTPEELEEARKKKEAELEQLRIDSTYKELISLADNKFEKGELDGAEKLYKDAVELKSRELHPITQLSQIESKRTAIKIATKELTNLIVQAYERYNYDKVIDLQKQFKNRDLQSNRIDSIGEVVRERQLGLAKGINFIKQNQLDDAIMFFQAHSKTNHNPEDDFHYIAKCFSLKEDDKNKDKFVEIYINKALNIAPKYEAVLQLRAEFNRNKGDIANSIKDYSYLISLDESNPNYYSERGLTYFQNKNNNNAIKDIYKSIEIDQENGSAYYYLSEIYNEINAKDSSLKYMNLAIDFGHLDPDLYFKRGYIHITNQNIKDAADDFRVARSLGLDRDKINILKTLADNYFNSAKQSKDKSDWQNMERLLKYGLELDPTNAAAWHDLANYYKATSNVDRQLTCLKEYNKLEPSKETLFKIGVLQFKKKNYDAADNTFKALINQKKEGKYVFYRGKISYNKGVYASAKLQFTEAVKLDNNQVYNYYLALTNYKLKSYEEGLKAIKTALRSNSDNPEYESLHGKLNYKLGQYMEAIDYLSDAYEHGNKRKDILELLTESYIKISNFFEAEYTVHKLVKLHGEDDHSAFLIGQILLFSNKAELAINYFQKLFLSKSPITKTASFQSRFAYAFYKAGEYSSVIDYYNSLSNAERDKLKAINKHIAISYVKTEQNSKAKEYFIKAFDTGKYNLKSIKKDDYLGELYKTEAWFTDIVNRYVLN